MGTLLKSSDDLPDQYRQALEDEGRDRARAFALSVSLAALEGNTADHSKGSRHLASTRGRHSFETGRQDINISVVEEDENERDSPAGENGPIRRPSLLKRLPSNSSGKIYVPKRSNSPGSVISSANPGGFPFPAMDPESAGHLDGDAEEMAAEPTAKDKTFSEGMPYRSFDQRPSSRLTGQRANSMAELPSTSRFDPPSVFTDRSEGGVHGLRMRQQVLSFNVGEQDIQYASCSCFTCVFEAELTTDPASWQLYRPRTIWICVSLIESAIRANGRYKADSSGWHGRATGQRGDAGGGIDAEAVAS